MTKQSTFRVKLAEQPAKTDPVLTTLASTTQRNQADDVSKRLIELRDWLADDLYDLEADLGSVVTDPGKDLAWKAVQHLLHKAGKRVRPICTLLAARMGERAFDEDVKQVAIAAELVHSATLLHDDVIDQGEERRGHPTARMVYGNSASVLGGDHLLVDALRRVNGADPRLVSSLLDVISQMVHAEALQLDMRNCFRPDRGLYQEVVHGKTAALFQWALEAGALLGDLNEHQISLLSDVGINLGMTFQLVDDKLDLCGDPTETGKDTCLDLREGKLTWPMILAAERSPELLLRLRQYASAVDEPTQSDAKALVEAIAATGAIEATHERAADFADKALKSLRQLPDGPSRSALKAVIHTALERSR